MEKEYFAPIVIAQRILNQTQVDDLNLALDIVFKITSGTENTDYFISEDFQQNLFDYINHLALPEQFTKKDFWSRYYRNLNRNNHEYEALLKLALYLESSSKNTCLSSDLKDSFNKEELSIYGKSKLIIYNNAGELTFLVNSLQEVLVAEELKALNTKDLFEKYLTIEINNKRYLNSSWFNVLLLLLETELANEYVDKIFEIISSDSENLTEDLMSLLLTCPTWLISNETKEKVFELVYNEYQRNRKIWFPFNSRDYLWKFVSLDDIKNLEREIASFSISNDYIQIGNIVYIISSVLENSSEYLNTERYNWKEKLIEIANADSPNWVASRYAFRALALFKDTAVLELLKVDDILASEDELRISAYFDLLGELKTNDIKSIDFFANYLESDNINLSVSSRENIGKIETNEGWNYLFEKMLKESPNFREVFWKDNIFTSKIIDKLRNQSSKELLNNIERVILLAFVDPTEAYYAERSESIVELAKLLAQSKVDIRVKVFNLIESNYDFYRLQNILIRFINEDNLGEYFQSITKTLEKPDEKVADLIYLKSLVDENEGEKLAKLAVENKWIKRGYYTKKTSNSEKKYKESFILDRFKEYLEPEPGKYNPQVFKYYYDNQKFLNTALDDVQRGRLLKVAKETWFDVINPRSFIIEKKDDGQIYYPSNVHILGDVYKCLYLLEKSYLLKNAQRVVDYIPFSSYEDGEFIKELILESSIHLDWSFVEDCYISNPLVRSFEPDSYIHICNELNNTRKTLLGLRTIECLKTIILDEEILNSYRIEALGLLMQIEPNKKFVQSLLEKKDEDKSFALSLQDVLIKYFEDEDAIKGRIEVLKKFAKPWVKNYSSGIHDVGYYESEMHEGKLLEPFLNISETKFSLILEIYDFSQKSLLEKESYRGFYSYILSFLIKYVSSKSNNLESIIFFLNSLETIIRENKDPWSLNDLERLRSQLISKYSGLSYGK